jgi:soluble lytic murein transglycosylase
LYDPTVNIELGTRYLAQLAGRFDGAPWLTSAAYNAGAGRVNQWLDARGTLPPDIFVATMPFKETREYVARVMYYSVIYDWRMHGNAATMSNRMTPIGQPYSRPNAQDPRKDISCAMATQAAPSSTAPAPPITAPVPRSTTATDKAH